LSPNRPVTFLFWNLGRKDLTDAVVAAVAEYGVDILILAEARRTPPAEVLVSLNRNVAPEFQMPLSGSNWLTIHTRFDRSYVSSCPSQPIDRDERWSVWRLHLPGRDPILLAGVHLLSKIHAAGEDQYAKARRLHDVLLVSEKAAGHARTMVVGDFNMDPFEPGVQACDSLHGVLSMREIAARGGTRIWDRQARPMFYNPMWRHHGDREGTPPGTYYYAGSGVSVQYWHLFDQVLLRPALMNCFLPGETRIVHSINGTSLLDAHGRPDTVRYSDHLPLLFRAGF
jgi:hypothetical protein